ncbi:MAG: CopG family antitoxin [Patescibacteria group bacterium]
MTKSSHRDPLPGKNVSREDLAQFWDTHSIADYMDILKPVRVRVAKNLSEGITIRFDSRTLNIIRKKAYEKGIGPTTLVRTWVHERLATAA